MRVIGATRRRPDFEPSIRRGDRRRIIREWALHRQDVVFGTDRVVIGEKRSRRPRTKRRQLRRTT
jgi:hypothetical protein